jgi:uncharacterized membrane protein YjjB (DUF3815 family)
MTNFEPLIASIRVMVLAGLAALGFAILFNVPKRLLPGCFLCGAAGYTLRAILMNSGASVEFSTLIGAVAVGFISAYLSDHYDVPASVFNVTGAIPLVPGVFAYQTIVGLLNATSSTADESVALLAAAGINGVRTTLILGVIAFGIAAPMLLFRRSSPSV